MVTESGLDVVSGNQVVAQAREGRENAQSAGVCQGWVTLEVVLWTLEMGF